LLESIPAHTYIFLDIRFLEPTLWSFDDFVKKNAWKWYGGSPSQASTEDKPSTVETPEVERRREAMIVGVPHVAIEHNPWA